jgi:hypothetical protein
MAEGGEEKEKSPTAPVTEKHELLEAKSMEVAQAKKATETVGAVQQEGRE